MTSDDFPRTLAVLDQAIQERWVPGVVAVFYQASDPTKFTWSARGLRRVEPSALPVLLDTPYDMSSVTKIIGTATLAAYLVERRWIGWNTSLKALLPEYPDPNVQLRHLLSHTAGLPKWLPLWQKMRDRHLPEYLHRVSIADRQNEMRREVSQIVPEVPLGSRALYSDISFLLLGFALEEATSLSLDRAISELIWRPMQLRETYFHRVKRSSESDIDLRTAATSFCGWRGSILQGQVEDENCWAMGGYGGHAGAFSTARDLMQFSASLLNGFLSQSILEQMWSRPSEPSGCERTLGWDTPSGDRPSVGQYFSPQTVGHLGFTGTSLWIDRQADLAVALLTNRVHPSRENQLIKLLRPKFHDALRLDLNDLHR